MNSRILYVCLILALSFQTHAQSLNIQSDTIRWNASGFTDLISNVVVNVPCQFISTGTQKLDWVQGNGSFISTYTAIGVSGSWDDLSSNGSITIGLTDGSLTGQIILSRSATGLKAELTITGGSGDIRNSYIISSIEKL